MKVSEVIQKLQQILDTHGDIPMGIISQLGTDEISSDYWLSTDYIEVETHQEMDFTTGKTKEFIAVTVR